MGFQSASASAGDAASLLRLKDVQRGVGVGNDTLRAILAEQQRANDLATQMLEATRETNVHLTFLITGLLQAGTIRSP